MLANSVSFYVNSLGCEGKVSLTSLCAEETSSTRVFLVRGAVSESGKFIKNVASSLMKEGIYIQEFPNFYDKNILDGAYFCEADTYIFDANFVEIPQRMIDCRCYTVDLGCAVSHSDTYKSRALIDEAREGEERFLKKATRFLSTAKSVQDDTRALSCDAVNADKIERFVSRFVKKEFGSFSSFSGNEYFRFLSAFTPNGLDFCEETVSSMGAKLYCIDDKTDACSSMLISQIRESAVLCGFDVISMLNPLKGGKMAEHIFVPELGLGVITSSKVHAHKGDCYRRISATRFLDSERMKKHKTRIKFNLNAESELLNQACFLLGEAKKSRDEYFEIYSRYTDSEKIKKLTEKTVSEILSFFNCT